MQPSEIIKRDHLAQAKEVLKSGTAKEKVGARELIKELELQLGVNPAIEKAQLATDEQLE